MMSPIAIEDDDYHRLNNSIVIDVEPIECMESPSSDRMIKVMDNVDSPTSIHDFTDNSSSNDTDFDFSQRSEGSHRSLQEMISKSLSQIDSFMGEIMNETSSSSNLNSKLLKRRCDRDLEDDDDLVLPQPPCLRACSTMGSADTLNLGSLQAELTHADHEEKQNFKKSVMANVERISNELEETRKNEEELKNRIEKLRGQLAQRRALRNRIVNASRIVEHNVNSLPAYLQDKPQEQQDAREPSEEKKEDSNGGKRSWLSMFRARRRARQEKEEEEKRERASKACRDADELVSSMRSTEEEESSSSFEEQQEQITASRRARFEKSGSWGSFVPTSRQETLS